MTKLTITLFHLTNTKEKNVQWQTLSSKPLNYGRQGSLQLIMFHSFVNEQVDIWHLTIRKKNYCLGILFIRKKKSQALCWHELPQLNIDFKQELICIRWTSKPYFIMCSILINYYSPKKNFSFLNYFNTIHKKKTKSPATEYANKYSLAIRQLIILFIIWRTLDLMFTADLSWKVNSYISYTHSRGLNKVLVFSFLVFLLPKS